MGKTLSKKQIDKFQPRAAAPNLSKEGPSKWLVKHIPNDITWTDTIPFVPPIKGGYGRVIKVYDGDTITIAGMLPYKYSKIYRFQVRLNGIDSPEMRTHNKSEKAVAILAQEALSQMIKGQWVILNNTGNDKYGRLLADVWFGDININSWMIDKRFAVPYDGGTKRIPADWELYYETGNMEINRSLYFDYENY